MHILYLSVPGGGLDTNVRVLSSALIEKGHRVSVLYLHLPGEKYSASDNPLEGAAVYHATIGSWHYYARRATFGVTSLPLIVRAYEYAGTLGRMVAEIDRGEKVDLVELPEMFVRRQGLNGIPYVIRLHSSAWMCRMMFEERRFVSDGIERRLEANALEQASGISSPSRFVADTIRQTCRVKHAIEIIPYPIDTCVFKPANERLESPAILFVGRVERRKGADVLLRAIPIVRAKYPECEFAFAGRVSDELKEPVASASNDMRTTFLGTIPREELVEKYQRASIFVAPAMWDNSPNTVYEAMACGTPVIATKVGGIPELVEDGVTGLLVPPRDEKVLAESIIELLGDPAQRQRMGQNGRARAVEEFAVEKIAARTMEFYSTHSQTREPNVQ